MKKYILTLISSLLMAGVSFASVVVQWGPLGDGLVTGNQGAASTFEDTSALDLSSGFTFDSTDYASAPLSPDFYAASRSFAGDGTTIEIGSTIQIQNNSTVTDQADGIIFGNGRQLPDTSFDGATNHAIAFWEVSSQTEALSSISLRAGRNAGANSAARAVIRLGTDYYISESLGALSFAGDGLGTGDELALLSITDPTSASWFNYDPETNFTTIGSAATITDFTGLTGAGFYGYNQDGGDEFRNIGLGEFEVAVVPEPTTYALLAGLFTLAGVLIRRRLKN